LCAQIYAKPIPDSIHPVINKIWPIRTLGGATKDGGTTAPAEPILGGATKDGGTTAPGEPILGGATKDGGTTAPGDAAILVHSPHRRHLGRIIDSKHLRDGNGQMHSTYM
jgi:hypothetical protein